MRGLREDDAVVRRRRDAARITQIGDDRRVAVPGIDVDDVRARHAGAAEANGEVVFLNFEDRAVHVRRV